LWDVLLHCERRGSLDADIRVPEINDFKRLLQRFPGIETIGFNGAKAYDLFQRLAAPRLDLTEIRLLRLPSSSPAHAVRLEAKLEAWKALFEAAPGLRYR
jgi:hypoxanthine-DNA glycosylase